MKKISMDYYREGYNCCESIIMAANKKYKLNLNKDILKIASPINNGMGVGSLCSAIIGGVMIIGYIFEKNISPEHTPINHIRMEFIDNVSCKLRAINCSQICKNFISENNCTEVISIIADVLDRVICKYKKSCP